MKKLITVGMFLVVCLLIVDSIALALQIHEGAVIAESTDGNELTVQTNDGKKQVFRITTITVFPGASREAITDGVQVIIEADGDQAIAINIQRK